MSEPVRLYPTTEVPPGMTINEILALMDGKAVQLTIQFPGK